jgi:hypothetical protein
MVVEPAVPMSHRKLPAWGRLPGRKTISREPTVPPSKVP